MELVDSLEVPAGGGEVEVLLLAVFFAFLRSQLVGARFLSPEVFALQGHLASPRVSGRRPGGAEVDGVEPRVAAEHAVGEELGVSVFVLFFLVRIFLVRVMLVVPVSATTIADLSVQNGPPEPPRRIAPEVASHAGKGRPRPDTVGRTPEREVVASKQADAELAVGFRGQDDGDLGTVVVVGVVQERPVGERTVREVVAVGVLLVQVAERPQGTARLDAHAFGQAGAGQGLDVRFLELQLGGLARVNPQAQGEVPQELVVDAARHRDLAVAQGESVPGPFALVAGRKTVNLELVGGVLGEQPVQDDADRGVEGVVGCRFGGRCGALVLPIRVLHSRLHG